MRKWCASGIRTIGRYVLRTVQNNPGLSSVKKGGLTDMAQFQNLYDVFKMRCLRRIEWISTLGSLSPGLPQEGTQPALALLGLQEGQTGGSHERRAVEKESADCFREGRTCIRGPGVRDESAGNSPAKMLFAPRMRALRESATG